VLTVRERPVPALATITPYGRDLIRKTRKQHHVFLQDRFGGALDDRDLADLTRIMVRVDAKARHPQSVPDIRHGDGRERLTAGDWRHRGGVVLGRAK